MDNKFIKWGIFMAVIYAQFFANSCNNSCITKTTQASGELNWAREIFTEGNEKEEIGHLLSAGNKVFIISASKINAFDNQGNFLWARQRWPKSPATIRNNKIFYTSHERKTRMQAIDFNNQVKTEDFGIPEITDNSFLVLFEPIENGLIAQVQYMPDPDEGETGFVVYRIHDGGLGCEWEKNFDDEKSRVIPLVILQKKILVTTTQKDAIVFNLENKQKEPAPTAQFPLPLGELSMWLSSSNDGILYWSGSEGRETKVISTDIQGKELWRWQSDPVVFNEHAVPLFPPIVAPEIVYILTPKKLFALKNGQKQWEFDSGTDNFNTATALNDNSILVTKAKTLLLINQAGGVTFNVDLEEELITAPTLDDNGQIYVASSQMLFCIK